MLARWDAVTYLQLPLLSTQTVCNGKTRARILDTLRCLWLWLTTFCETSAQWETAPTPTDHVFHLSQAIVTSRLPLKFHVLGLCWGSRNFITGLRHVVYWFSKVRVAFKFFFWTWLFYLTEFFWHLPVPRRNSPTFEQLGRGYKFRAHYLQFLDAEKLRSVQFSLTTLVFSIFWQNQN